VRKADNLPPSCVVTKSGDLNFLETSGSLQACNGTALPLIIGRSLVRSKLVSVEFFIDIKSFRPHYGPGVDSASHRNEYQEYFLGGKGGRCVRLTTYVMGKIFSEDLSSGM